ncbi:MAG: DUF1304 domain-containing protein [Cryobacterium sp.]|nr:DUF1304 domain-containing protein [Cryobacterium sp.]MCO5294999.1 DUF1304 domain-containing protein [Homoserinimonas sp.]MCW5945004.1 DUF1304 domain-containing protein [Cryobacterium sp.]
MATTLQILLAVFASIAAIIHVAIFVMESILWPKPSIWKRFGVKSQADADVLEQMAFNQGFYNLFLAVGTGIGLFLLVYGNVMGGKWVLLVTLSSMVLAAVVLTLTNRKFWRAALFQGLIPLLGIVVLLWAVAIHVPLMVL